MRYVEVINDDRETVTMKVSHKQLCYMAITSRLKQMFLSERTVIHMRWHKDGEWENKEVMVHSSDGDAWKDLDNFDLGFAQDATNVRIALTTDGLTPFNENAASYSCWPMFDVLCNLPPLCMKYDFMFLYLVIPNLDHPGPKLIMMLKPLIDELKEM
jgi:hypothetical protein